MAYSLPQYISLNVYSATPGELDELVVMATVKSTVNSVGSLEVAGIWIPGAMLVDLDTATIFINDGSTAVPNFVAIAGLAPVLPALTDGNIWVGDATDVAQEVVISGDISMDNAGLTAVVAVDLEAATVTNIADTEILIGTGAGTAAFAALSGDATMDNTGAVEVSDLTISGETAGDILYFDGTNWIRLAIGTAGQVLTVNGGGTAPVWA